MKWVSQRISKERVGLEICHPYPGSSAGVTVGLLVAMYIEPLAAGQIGDEGVPGGGVVVARLTD